VSTGSTNAVLGVVALIMLGLGLGLTAADFWRVARYRRTIAVALVCQLFVLPAGCFAIVTVLNVPPAIAVGVMLISASPGGPMAGVYSHLFGGDVAFNITLTAVNAVLSTVTLTVIADLSIHHFLGAHAGVGLQPAKVAQVFAVTGVPIAIGMLARTRWPEVAVKAGRPVKIFAALALAAIVAGSLKQNFPTLTAHFRAVGAADLIFALLSLTIGYWAPRLAGAQRRQATAASMEIGFHNYAMASAIAIAVLRSPAMALPAAVYGLWILVLAAGSGFLLRRRNAAFMTQEERS
jgi:bile acid:Na+ symporter, BASS family